MQIPRITPAFFLRYSEPLKVPTNPCWCPYAKGSPRDDQAPRTSNFIESQGPSPHASGAPLSALLGCSPLSSLSSFRPKCRGPCSLRYTVAVVSQTQLIWLAPLGTITTTHTRAEGYVWFSKLTQLTWDHL
jgi:hypothetical protein